VTILHGLEHQNCCIPSSNTQSWAPITQQMATSSSAEDFIISLG